MSPALPRRTFLAGAGAAAAIILSGCSSGATRDSLSTVDTLDFVNPLKLPPLAPSTLAPDGARVFDLTAAPGTSAFQAGKSTPTWGYNGAFLGPTLRARRGETVRIRVRSALPDTTTLHWHGMHLPAAFDGGPHQPIGPGSTWTPEWTIDQPAATLWYHPHPHGATERQVIQGLAGMFIIDGNEPPMPGLPAGYGVDDIPVIIQDRTFGADGAFRMGSRALTGLLGDTILVNGTCNPHLPVTTQALRLRLLNASSARVYNFGFSDDRQFSVIAGDGGLLPAPVLVDRLLLSPGERAELVVRFAPGEQTVLRSFAQDLGMTGELSNGAGGNDVLDVLAFRAAAVLAASAWLPQGLAVVEGIDPGQAAATRNFILNGTQINGRPMDMARIDLQVRAGSVEVWNVSNTHNQAHNFHVHGARFRILELNGADPAAESAGWKDTVFLPVRTTVRLALKFGRYADPEIPYMYHCHLLRHEDQGMMGQFTVLPAAGDT